LRKAGWKARYHQEKRIQLHKSGGKYAFNARPFLLLSSDSVTLIVQRFCPLAVDSRVSTDDSSPVSLC
jgi:hypothetical protein